MDRSPRTPKAPRNSFKDLKVLRPLVIEYCRGAFRDFSGEDWDPGWLGGSDEVKALLLTQAQARALVDKMGEMAAEIRGLIQGHRVSAAESGRGFPAPFKTYEAWVLSDWLDAFSLPDLGNPGPENNRTWLALALETWTADAGVPPERRERERGAWKRGEGAFPWGAPNRRELSFHEMAVVSILFGNFPNTKLSSGVTVEDALRAEAKSMEQARRRLHASPFYRRLPR